MFFCFLCNEHFDFIKALFHHFTLHHGLLSNTPVSCGNSECFMSFTNFKALRIHLLNSHVASVMSGTNSENSEFDENGTSFDCGLENNNQIFEIEPELQSASHSDWHDTSAFGIDDCKQEALKYMLKLHHNPKMPRSKVNSILKEITNYIVKPIGDYLNSTVMSKLRASEPIESDLATIINYCHDPFNETENTEYRFLKTLEKRNLYSEPNQIVIDQTEAGRVVVKNGKEQLVPQITSITMMPIKFNLKHFFELPDVFTETMKYMDYLENTESDKIENFIQGSVWKEKKRKINEKHGEVNVIPYFLFNDDVGITNPLGGHSKDQSLNATYAAFPTLPIEMCSKLRNILPMQFIKSSKKKKYHNEQVFQLLVDEMIDLETNGLEIEVNGETLKVYFVLGLIIGNIYKFSIHVIRYQF